MNETVAGSIVLVLLLILRCLIPLGVLFGISYLLRRLEWVIDRSDEALFLDETNANAPKLPIVPAPKVIDSPPRKRAQKKETSGGKKKSAISKKRSRNQ